MVKEICRFELRIPKTMQKELKRKSESTGNPISSIIRLAINEYLYGPGVKE